MGIAYHTYEGNNAVVGLIRGHREGQTVALRADMDALPIQENSQAAYCSQKENIMHACGHDGHMAILLGTAKVLVEQKHRLKGNVKLLFQPAEETVGGAKNMIALGCMENPKVDYVFSQHMDPEIECGTLRSKANEFNASSDVIEIIVKGKKAHGASPDLGIDAIYVAANMILSLQSILSRRVGANDAVALNIGKFIGGVAHNVIADEARLSVMLRATKPAVRSKVKAHLIKTVHAIAHANDAQVTINMEEGYDAIVNDEGSIERVVKIAKTYLGEKSYTTMEYPFLGVEDFAYFLHEAKGAFYQLGSANMEKGILGQLHTSEYDMDENTLLYGMLMQLGLVFDIIGEENDH